MDALDAGAYAVVYEAEVPRSLKVTLWGPLMAREFGFEGWTYQDGGETGFIYHLSGRPVRLGLATATLIAVRRLGRAYLAVYLGGYPTDTPEEQRHLDCRAVVTEAELFLSRLANQTVHFSPTRELVLVAPTAQTPAPFTKSL